MVHFKVEGGVVALEKEITKLDQFALDVVGLVQKYTDYVIISGYVSIFFGRARATEDIDMFIKNLSYDLFSALYEESVTKGYEWTVDNPEDLYFEYLKKCVPICIWRKAFPLLRIEMKIATKPSQLIQFQDKITVKFKGQTLFMANIEGQIAYKRYIAKSEKDLADARHLELVFQGINPAKIQHYRKLFEEEFNEGNPHAER